MKQLIQTITPCLWFENQGEAAAKYYVSIFKRSKITAISRYSKVGHEIHGRPAGSVMTVAFELDGQAFTALNGGPVFKFNEAISLQVYCDTQKELDGYWTKLSRGGKKQAQQCGWLKDKYGVSWQIVPRILPELLMDSDSAKSQRVFQAVMNMQKLNIAALQKAAAG